MLKAGGKKAAKQNQRERDDKKKFPYLSVEVCDLPSILNMFLFI